MKPSAATEPVLALLQTEYGVDVQRQALLAPILSLYESQGLLQDGIALPLHERCPCAEFCWAGAPQDGFPEEEYAGISLPWVGPGYLEAGIVVVAVNFRGWGGLFGNWQIKRDEIARLRAGQRRINNSAFAYAVGSYVDAVRGCLGADDFERTTPPEPEYAAAGLERCAFLQAVKCAPSPNWLPRSAPNWPMPENCPREYLVAELDALAPRAIVLLGGIPTGKLRTLRRTGGWTWGDDCARGRMDLNGSEIDVFECDHPAAFGQKWRRSHAELCAWAKTAP